MVHLCLAVGRVQSKHRHDDRHAGASRHIDRGIQPGLHGGVLIVAVKPHRDRQIERPQHQSPQSGDGADVFDNIERGFGFQKQNRSKVGLLACPKCREVADQVLMIKGAGEGMLDTVPVNLVQVFEKEFLAYMNSENNEVVTEIRVKRELSDAGNAKFKEAVTRFLSTFKTKHKLG